MLIFGKVVFKIMRETWFIKRGNVLIFYDNHLSFKLSKRAVLTNLSNEWNLGCFEKDLRVGML